MTLILAALVALLVIAVVATYFLIDRPQGQFLISKSVLHIGANVVFGIAAFGFWWDARGKK